MELFVSSLHLESADAILAHNCINDVSFTCSHARITHAKLSSKLIGCKWPIDRELAIVAFDASVVNQFVKAWAIYL